MRLSRFICSVIFLTSAIVAFACGPFDAVTSNPFVFHFYQGDERPIIIETQKTENIALWQNLTSKAIPASEVETAVYDMDLSQLQNVFESGKTDNAFLAWIIKNNAKEIKEFLLLAKELEELRLSRISPWYYPANKNENFESKTEVEKFANILERCRKHTTGFLSDRYGLQYVRALMTLHKYDECFDFYNRVMSGLSDKNLFKKMAKGYVAGCLRRMGKTEEANRMFAEVGDFNSIANDKEPYFRTLVRNNPESDVIKSRLNNWIGYGDNLAYIGIADAALSSPRIVNRGDWLYLKAFIEERDNGNHAKALRLVRDALNHSFSRPGMRSDAALMELCLSAGQGEVEDLRYYVETLQDKSMPFFFYIVPALLKQGRVSDAILLTNYASSIERPLIDGYDGSFINGSYYCYRVPDDTYANTGFQLMLSRTAQEIVNYKNYLTSNSALVRKVIGQIRHDDDYLNEIIGTLYLREGNYSKAAEYLAQVSPDYQKNLNVYKCGYLNDNPWYNCYMPADKWDYPLKNEETDKSLTSTFKPANSSLLLSPDDAKLNFAKEMLSLQQVMKTGTPDERGMARIRFALARFNSFYCCWALTQYWEGYANQCNYRHIYWVWGGKDKELDYIKESGKVDQKWVDAQIEIGMRELQSPEALAEAQFLMGNYQTIAKKYPDSSVGKYLSTHCDSWKDWL